jgi:ribosomal protein L24
MKQLITDAIAVRPGVDEVKLFAKIIDERRSSALAGPGGAQSSSTTKGGKTKGGYDSSGDELTGEILIKNTFMANGNTSEFSKGDKIRVIAGDLNGISGKVVSMEIETGFINFLPIGIPGFTNELRLEVKNVVKYFEPGDYVRVIDGKYRGETGLVISSTTTDEGVVFSNIALTQSHREIKVRANNLKIKTEIEQSAASSNSAYFMDKAKPAPYSAGDLITYDNNKYVGVVLSVDSMGGPGSDLIRLINEEGTVCNIRGN